MLDSFTFESKNLDKNSVKINWQKIKKGNQNIDRPF
jgi:hypothetical protein